MKTLLNGLKRSINRRSFMKKGLTAAAATVGSGLLASRMTLLGEDLKGASVGLTPGDAALLRFAAAAEILESDF
jgi:hypothetical protein